MLKCWINLIRLAASSVLIASLKLRYPKLLQKDYFHCLMLMHTILFMNRNRKVNSALCSVKSGCVTWMDTWILPLSVSRSYVSSTLKEWKIQLRKSSSMYRDRDRAERLWNFINFPICPVLLILMLVYQVGVIEMTLFTGTRDNMQKKTLEVEIW